MKVLFVVLHAKKYFKALVEFYFLEANQGAQLIAICQIVVRGDQEVLVIEGKTTHAHYDEVYSLDTYRLYSSWDH